jgi:mannose-1-phosphate guanylyltransferase
MIIKDLYRQIIAPYEKVLDLFFDPANGAVYEPGREDGTPPFLFTEVTGYALLDYLRLYALTGNETHIEKAKRAADWIRTVAQDPCGGVLTRYFFDQDADPNWSDKSFAGRRIYAFDTAICLRGMINLFDFTGDPDLLESSRRMGDFLCTRMMQADGQVAAIFDAGADRSCDPNPDVWSRRFSAFHTKVAEALIDLHRSTGEASYRDAAISICEAAMRFQTDAGAFETSSDRAELHPHCYATEGFLHVGRVAGRADFVWVARKATEWALDQCRDGEIAQSFDLARNEPLARFRTDSLAQVLALASDLRQIGELTAGYDDTLDALAGKVLSMRTGPGGYYQYGFYERPFGGKFESDTRSYWTQMFCLRGFTKYYVSFLIGKTTVTLLAGGIGSRLWPISCENRPKPVSLSLLGDRSLLQETLRRYTSGQFVPPRQIHILCSENAVEQATSQALEEGVPEGNCVIEEEPRGTVPAVAVALDGLPPMATDQERLVVISMGDNVIDPYWSFQNAVTAALIAAYEHDCIVSVGKPADKTADVDTRFGHLFHQTPVAGYRAHQVDRFVEKPDADQREHFSQWPGSLAWECGTVVFKESVYRKLVPPNPESGNLAEDLLAKAAPWGEQRPDSVKLATALLDTRTRFEDFGVPGRNIQRFYAGHPDYDFGNGNTCIGNPSRVSLLGSGGCLVIADELPVRLYGVNDLVVVDNAVTNTAVVLPADEVHRLPALYRLFSGSKGYEAFVSGGAAAREADPTTFVERSPEAHAYSDAGLVFVYQLEQRVTIRRTAAGLTVSNDDYPALSDHDFGVLAAKQAEDPRLVEQLINVGAVARSLLGDDVTLSRQGCDVLDKLCLYHAFGGILTVEGERREATLLNRFDRISGLDHRQLDTRIVGEMLRQEGGPPEGDTGHADERLLNANVSSALALLQLGGMAPGALRDAVLAIIQTQDSPGRLRAILGDLPAGSMDGMEREIAIVSGLFKMAQTFVNGRWLWKRRRARGLGDRAQGFLRFDRGSLEELPFVLAFAAEWLATADLDPAPLIDRVNRLLLEPDSRLASQLDRLQDGAPDLVCDLIYRQLLAGEGVTEDELERGLEAAFGAIEDEAEQRFQIDQILELPRTLQSLSKHCRALDKDTLATVHGAVAGFYHRNWKTLGDSVRPELVSGLVAGGG